MVKKLHVLHLTAIFVVISVYSGLFPVKNLFSFSSVLITEDIKSITGKIVSNPVKQGGKSFYKVNFSTEKCFSKNDCESSCNGIISVFLPAEFAEAYQPGKLYTKSGNNGGIIVEQGYSLKISGKFSNGIFICSRAENIENAEHGFLQLYKIRAILRIYLRRLMFTWGNAGGLFMALISGIKEYTDASVCENFRKAGLSHILALSGMHLSLFSNLSRKLTAFIKNSRLQAVIQLISIFTFVWFAGISPSLYRALLFASAGLLSKTLKCYSFKMTDILCISFLIHCITRPFDLLEISFMLSYGAIAGILILSELFKFITISGIPENISGSLSASTGAQFFTTPVTIKCMGTFTPIGIISTMFISPLVSFFIYTGLFFTFLGLALPATASIGAILMNILYNLIEKLAEIFAAFPSISIK